MSNRRSLFYTLFIASVIVISESKQGFYHEPSGSISLIGKNYLKNIDFLQNKGDTNTPTNSTEDVTKTDTKDTEKVEKSDNHENVEQKANIETKNTKSTINTHNPAIVNNSDNSDNLTAVEDNKNHEHDLEDVKTDKNEDKVDKNNHIRGAVNTDEHQIVQLNDTKSGKRYAVIIITISTLIFSILFQLFGGFIENKVDNQNDKYISSVFNTCCRQVATISLINLIIWILLQSKIALSLDYMFFDNVADINNDKNISDDGLKTNTIEVAFEYSLYISVLLMIWYICYSLYFYITVRGLIKWLRKVDELDVDLTIRKIDYVNKKWFSWLLYKNYISKWQFLALRYDFEENISNANIQGLDSAGIYFMDYLRISLLEKSYKLLRMPNYCLVIILFGILLLSNKFDKENEVTIVCTLLSVCFVIILTVYLHIKTIQNKLTPTNLSHYLTFKNHKDPNTIDHVDQFGNYEIVKPQYKLQPLKPVTPKFYTEFLYGTTNPNKHDQLFIFMSNGPNVLLNIITTINFTILVVLSLWLFLMHDHTDIWVKDNFGAIWFICSVIVILCLLWPNLLYSLLIVTQGGMMIDVNTLATVWEARRAENTKHGVELIDGIGLHAGLYSLISGGDVQWRHLLAKFKTFSIAVREQLIASWNGLQQNNEKGGSVTIKQAAKYLYSQGLTNVPPKLVNDFIKSFSRTIPGKLIQEEFLMFALMVKQVIVSPLETVTLKPLFEEVYKILWTCENGINCMSLQFICQQIGLKWSYGTRKHFIHFLSAGTKTEMSPEDFVVYLRDLEDYIMQKAQDNTHYILYGNDTQVPVKQHL